jgi:quercetin dioxygenase-like cupin family protein
MRPALLRPDGVFFDSKRRSEVNLLRALPLVLCVVASTCWAQAIGVTVKPLIRTNLSGDDGKETVIAAIEFAQGATTGVHTHPGDEYAVVLEGTLELRFQGQPGRQVSAGQAYHNARGVVHETVNVGDKPAKSVATFVIEKGKPLVAPAPK